MEQQIVDDEFKRKISLMPQKELEEFTEDSERKLKELEEKRKQLEEKLKLLEEFKILHQEYIQRKNQHENSLKNLVLESMKYDKEYNDNWIIESFDENRKKKIVKYVWYLLHKNEKIENIENAYENVLYDLTQNDTNQCDE